MVLTIPTLLSINDLLANTFIYYRSPEKAYFWNYLSIRFYKLNKYDKVTDEALCSLIEKAEERYTFAKKNWAYKPIPFRRYEFILRNINKARQAYKDQPTRSLYYLLNRISRRLQYDAQFIGREEYLYVTAFRNIHFPDSTRLFHYQSDASDIRPLGSYA